MVKTPANPGGLPNEVFDGLRKEARSQPAQFYLDFASGPFYSSTGQARSQYQASSRTGGGRP